MNKKRMTIVILSLLEDLYQHENESYKCTCMMVETYENSLEPAGPTLQKHILQIF